MQLDYPSFAEKKRGCKPAYVCEQNEGPTAGIAKHRTHLHILTFDKIVVQAIREILLHPHWVREQVAELLAKPEPVVTPEDIQATIVGIKQSLKNLYALAEKATEDETIADIAQIGRASCRERV